MIMFILDWVGIGLSPIVKSWIAVGEQVYEVINAGLAWWAEANSTDLSNPAIKKKVSLTLFHL